MYNKFCKVSIRSQLGGKGNHIDGKSHIDGKEDQLLLGYVIVNS